MGRNIFCIGHKCTCVKNRKFFGKLQDRTCKIWAYNKPCHLQVNHKKPNIRPRVIRQNSMTKI